MSPDDIDSLALDLHDFLGNDMPDARITYYEDLKDFLYEKLEPFVTRDRNHN